MTKGKNAVSIYIYILNDKKTLKGHKRRATRFNHPKEKKGIRIMSLDLSFYIYEVLSIEHPQEKRMFSLKLT